MNSLIYTILYTISYVSLFKDLGQIFITYHFLRHRPQALPSAIYQIPISQPVGRDKFPNISYGIGKKHIPYTTSFDEDLQPYLLKHPEYTSSLTFRNFPSKCFITLIQRRIP